MYDWVWELDRGGAGHEKVSLCSKAEGFVVPERRIGNLPMQHQLMRIGLAKVLKPYMSNRSECKTGVFLLWIL